MVQDNGSCNEVIVTNESESAGKRRRGSSKVQGASSATVQVNFRMAREKGSERYLDRERSPESDEG